MAPSGCEPGREDAGLLWGLAATVGAVVGFVTGWPVAVPLVAVAVIGLPKLFGQTSASASITKIEAMSCGRRCCRGLWLPRPA